MKYLKTFERMGFPDSLEPIENYLCDFIMNKFLTTKQNKYSENFVFNMNDINKNIPLNRDFPIQELKLLLKIFEFDYSSVSGLAYHYTSKKYWHSDSYISKGKIFASINIEIMNKDKSSLEIDRINRRLHQMVRHELLHLYKGYKTLIKKINPKEAKPMAILCSSLLKIMYEYEICDNFNDLIYTYYHFVSNDEFNSYMAQLTDKTTLNKEGVQGYKSIRNILNSNYNELYDKILKEFKEHYPTKDLNKIPEEFYLSCKRSYMIYKIKTAWLEKKYDTTFDNFIKIMFDEIQQKKLKFIKKSNKIFHSR
jgi:hypothetical protein